MRTTDAIVRPPCPTMADGLTTAALGSPDQALALTQHEAYRRALEAAGVAVTVLAPLDDFPDSCFVEDVAICTSACTVVTRPGAPSRRAEVTHIEAALAAFYDPIERIEAPGRLDGGDVLSVGNRYFIGLTERTDAEGARQLIAILERHAMTAEVVPVTGMLHLKSGVAWLGGDLLLVRAALAEQPVFAGYRKLLVADDEAYAANAVLVNGRVLLPAGHPKTRRTLEEAGMKVVEVETSEFQKLDGGLSCLSLRLVRR